MLKTKTIKTIDNYVVDFPDEQVDLSLIELDNKEIYIYRYNKSGDYIHKVIRGSSESRIEYDRDKKILDHCFDLYFTLS